jgi:2,3,4,5-tetrahydropyridine-2-carboxylate N-succinyltransferase
MQQIIEQLWQEREKIKTSKEFKGQAAKQSTQAMQLLDEGKITVATKIQEQWQVNQWVKQAILLYFISHDSSLVEFSGSNYFDKVPLKFNNWGESDFQKAMIRVVPGAFVRFSAYIAPNAVIMPSFINVGARVGEGTMIDTYASVNSCAQVGKNCHISASVCIGGVLEPLQATPVIIEDNVFIGAGSMVVEGVIVEEGSVVASGTILTASTKIFDRESGNIIHGRIPAYSVVVPGTIPSSDGKTQLSAAIIVKRVDEQTRKKTSTNDILRSI